MLRACVLGFQDSWVLHLSLVEFAFHNSYQASIGMAPYKALYGRKCWTPLCWDEVGEKKLENVEVIEATSKKIKIIRDGVGNESFDKDTVSILVLRLSK